MRVSLILDRLDVISVLVQVTTAEPLDKSNEGALNQVLSQVVYSFIVLLT